VRSPRRDDQEKLKQDIRYLRGIKDLGLTLEVDYHVEIIAYIDASYGVHPDKKSHTGAMITLGKGCIHGKSGTQRLNRKSSTEAEFVTIGDAANQVLWTRNFMLAQGYRRGPAKVYQDNMSTIQLIKNGRSNRERTHRHFDIRHFFLTDRVSSGDITISYMKTQDMVADILTKPLQGQQFKKLRSLLLNTN
jgi:hypothetical protein